MTRSRWVIVAILAVLGLIGIGLLGRSALSSRDRTWARIRETGVWRVGMDPSFPPFENLDPASGKPAGLDVELAEAIAARWGVRAEFVGVGFDQLMDAVVAHRIDSAISALPIASHRTQEMRFSDPYIEAGMALVAPEGSSLLAAFGLAANGSNPLTGEAQSVLTGRRVAAEWGSEGDTLARTMQARQGGTLQLVLRDSTNAALEAVESGDADAAIVDAISLAMFAQRQGGKPLVPVGQPLRSDPYAIVVPIDAPELLRQVNEALAVLQADGTMAQIKARWLGAAAP